MAGASTELLGLWPTLVDKTLVDPGVTVTVEEVYACRRIALRELCGYRAGDKGDTADVAVLRRTTTRRTRSSSSR